MYEIDNFRIVQPLILRKTPAEVLKTWAKNAALTIGVDLRGWRAIQEAWRNPHHEKTYKISEDQLDDEKIHTLAAYAEQRVLDYAQILASAPDDALAETIQYTTVPILGRLIIEDGTIKSVMDAGCYYVRVLATLARQHPEIRWSFVDFMSNLAAVNAAFAASNVEFCVDYPLRALQRAPTGFDVVHFNRVFALCGRREIECYMDVLSQKARYVVFGEPTKIIARSRDLVVDEIDFFLQAPGYRTFNCRKLLERYGFQILHHDAVRTSERFSGDQHFIIRGLARNRRLT